MRKISLFQRLFLIVSVLSLWWLFNQYFKPSEVELLVQVPEEYRAIEQLQLRIFDDQNVQKILVQQPKTSLGRTLVFHVSLAKKTYRIEAFSTPERTPLQGSFQMNGQESVEVELKQR